MLRSFLAIAVGLALVSVSHASVITTFSRSQTVGLAGYYTWVVAASSDDGSQIVGFDFASQPSFGFYGRGFVGTFNQVNPVGLPTIFQDNNVYFQFVGADISQDTQFLFNSSNIVVPAGFASETSTSLRAKFTSYATFGTVNVPFVQLVVPDEYFYGFRFRGTVTVARDDNFYDELVEWPVPEPATSSLFGMACASLVGMRRRRK